MAGDWWSKDTAASGLTFGNDDPNMAIQSVQTPGQLVAGPDKDKQEEQGGFMGFLGKVKKAAFNPIDKALSNVPGWGVTKNAANDFIYTPIDKAASGLYWVQSNFISQPLSTLILTEAQAEGDFGSIFKGSTWKQNYEAAEHISPGQAYSNASFTRDATTDNKFLLGVRGAISTALNPIGGLSEGIGATGLTLSDEDKAKVKANKRKYLYDTDFWREKSGWQYDVGSGAFDGATTIGLDAPGAVIGITSKGVKAATALKAVESASGTRVAQGPVAAALGRKEGQGLGDAIESGKIDDFTDWIAEKNPSQAEIAQHPIWGTGRRKNDKADTLSGFLVGQEPDEIRRVIRYSMGDETVIPDLVGRSRDTANAYANAIENRQLVESARLDPDMLEYYRNPSAMEQGLIDPGKMYAPPTPRPKDGDPMQASWDARWGDLEAQSKAHREVGEELKRLSPVSTTTAPRQADFDQFEAWRASKLEDYQTQVDALSKKDQRFASLLGGNYSKPATEFSPAATDGLYGSVTELKGVGPLSLRNSQKQAERRWKKMNGARGYTVDPTTGEAGGIISRTIQSGMRAPVRFFDSASRVLPPGSVNHTANDSVDRVASMLREVKGYHPELRMSQVADYANAATKQGRSAALENIHFSVIDHLAAKHGLSHEFASELASQVTKKIKIEHGKISGSQAFSGLEDPTTGLRLDQTRVKGVDDGEVIVTSPLLDSQNSQAEPLLDVATLDRALARSAPTANQLLKTGANVKDVMVDVLDSLSTTWKLGALFRLGYPIRNIAETTAAASAKLGTMGTFQNLKDGGWDLIRNRNKVGISHRTGELKGKVSLADEAEIRRAESLGLAHDKVKISPAIQQSAAFMKNERKLADELTPQIKAAQDNFRKLAEGRLAHYKNQDALDDAATSLSDAYARTAALRAQRTAQTSEITSAQGGKLEAVPVNPAQVRLGAEDDLGELADIHRTAEKFLAEAEAKAGTGENFWGDSSWKYRNDDLDELRAWHKKTGEDLRKAQLRDSFDTAAAKATSENASKRVEQFEKAMAKLTGEREWWNKSLTAAERHEAQARQALGDAADKVHYYDADAKMMELHQAHLELKKLQAQKADHENMVKEHSAYTGALLRQAEKDQKIHIGDTDFEFEGMSVPGIFSSKWEFPIPRDQVTSQSGQMAQWARSEAMGLNRLVKTGGYDVVKPGADNYMDAWLRAVNFQMGNSKLARLVAENPDKARSFMNTPDGKNLLKALGNHGNDPDDLLRKLLLQQDKYLPHPELLQKFRNGEQIHAHDLEGFVSPENMPSVSGEELAQLDPGRWSKSADGMITRIGQGFFKYFSSVPTDILAHQPIFARLGESNMKELIHLETNQRRLQGIEGPLDASTMNRIQQTAAQKAKSQMATIVYDPKNYKASDALRFATPFLNAHIDSLQRWFGLIAEKPQLVNTASKIYGTPIAANMVTDKDGRHVGKDGYAEVMGPDGKMERKFIPMKERVLHLKMPWAKPGKGKEYGTIPIQNLNVIAPGDPWWNPGTGPFVQVAGSRLAKQSPAAGDFLQWAKVLPYGPTSTAEAFTPKTLRTLKDSWDVWTNEDSGNQKYQQAMLTIYNSRIADWNAGGEKGTKPTMEDAKDEARNFMFLQFLTSATSPAQTTSTPLTGTPYQFYVDAYRQLQEVDPATADDRFYAKYGPDYYQFAASMNKSMGIAPTLEAFKASEDNRKLLEQYPEYANFITGGKDGKFSSSVYAIQQDQIIGGQKVRQKLTAQEAADQSDVDAGWRSYNKYMNYIDSLLVNQGLTSYSQKGAEGLAAAKAALPQLIAQQNPAWFKKFGTVDNQAIQKTVGFMTAATSNPTLASDPMRATTLDTMSTYLQGRAMYKEQLSALGLHSFSVDVNGNATGEGALIGLQFQQFQQRMKEQNTQFGDFFNYNLSNDRLQ